MPIHTLHIAFIIGAFGMADFKQLVIAVMVCFVFGWLAFIKKWLSASGAVAAAVMGAVILLAGGWRASVPMLLFFVAGSLLSKMPLKNVAIKEDKKEKKPRDWVQVICNGGVATVCLLMGAFAGRQMADFLYLASIAISMADTASSEWGKRFGGTPIDILRWKKLPAGISGGISLKGTLAGLAGALLISATCWTMGYGSRTIFLGITIIGFVGMLVDSFLGSWLQVRYITNSGSMAEFASEPGIKLQKGFVWITNDGVNVLSNIITVLLAWLLFNACFSF